MAGKTTKPKSSENSPAWLAAAGLFDGDWMKCSKLTLSALINPFLFTLKANILGVLLIQTFGYETELGVVMRKLKENEDPAKVKRFVRDYTDKNGRRITEAITPQGIASMIIKAGMEALKLQGIKPTAEQAEQLKTCRQNIRRVLERMELDGMIVRVRSNCPPAKLAGVSFTEAKQKGLVTEFDDLPKRDRKKLGTGRVCIYLLARPRKPRELDLGSQFGLPNSGKPIVINDEKRALQLAFKFAPELKGDRQYAQELVRSEQGQREIALYHQTLACAHETAEQRLKLFFQSGAEKRKAKTEPDPRQTGLFVAPVSSPDLELVLETMRQYCEPDDKAAELLIQRCREHVSDATAVQICAAVDARGSIARKKDNPVGFLITASSQLFAGRAGQMRDKPKPGHCVNCGAPPDRRSQFGSRCNACGQSFDEIARSAS